MKKLLTSIVLLVSLVSALAAHEWGGIVKEDAKFSTADFTSAAVSQSNSLFLWFKTPLGENWNFSSEALYKYNLSYVSKTSALTNVIDVDLFKLSGKITAGNGLISVNAGRYMCTDNTGITFAQTCDGLSLKYSLPSFQTSIYGGYTGLLNANTVVILGPNGTAYSPENQIYSCTKAYIPVIADLTFPVLFANQTLSVQAEAFIDPSEAAYNRYYASTFLSGFIGNSFNYTFVTQFSSENFDNLGNYSAVEFSFGKKNLFTINTGLKYASKDFTGFTSTPAYASSQSAEYKDVVIPYINGTYTETKAIVNAGLKTVFKCQDSFTFKGIDLGMGLSYNVFSDLQFGADVHGYLDLQNKDASNYSLGLKASLAF